MATPIEIPIAAEILDQFADASKVAAQVLCIDQSATPSAIVGTIDKCVLSIQRDEGIKLPDDEEPALLLGSLWGRQLIRELDWQWTCVKFADFDNATAVGVASRDRSLVIYPFHFLISCLEHAAPVTIRLAMEILTDGGRVPSLPANGFENVMDHVHLPPNE